jgi:hypothetical protein
MKIDNFSIDEASDFWIYRIHTQGKVTLRKAFNALTRAFA